jgi:hypothetical protein
MMVEALHVDPKRCVYLDDLGVNLKPAREMGMTTIKVVNAPQTIAELGKATGLVLCSRPSVTLYLQLHHVEVALGRTAFRTNPVVWNVSPPGARSQAFVRCAGCFVIDVAASPALPGFVGLIAHLDSRSCMVRGRDVSRV